ncbi:ATP-dependent RNA helicase DDX24-like [Arapaima gigas]
MYQLPSHVWQKKGEKEDHCGELDMCVEKAGIKAKPKVTALLRKKATVVTRMIKFGEVCQEGKVDDLKEDESPLGQEKDEDEEQQQWKLVKYLRLIQQPNLQNATKAKCPSKKLTLPKKLLANVETNLCCLSTQIHKKNMNNCSRTGTFLNVM